MSEDFEDVALEATVDSPKLDEMAFELIKIGWEKHDWSGTLSAPSSLDIELLAEAAAEQVMIMYRELTAAIDRDMEDDEEEA